MEHKIGEIVTLPDGRKAKVKETDYGCVECMFYPKCNCSAFKLKEDTRCSRLFRKDHKSVIYKEIKED